ncbi:prolyl aminopeptidase [Streptomonospora alba]|uniref:prolyl aminopeptidase n=1 Tax=Streptomonospora alba TaxID=183763 RepID=UPI000A9BEF3D|nr:prolyl aminopeptidase [Streptomonospora alba]
MYPPIEPHAQGMLEVGGGDRCYWEACGHPRGEPALVVHGGPGSGCTPRQRRLFDPRRYRAILFDQRNCGRSRPHAAEASTDLSANTTPNLVADIERLRIHLGIDRWLVHGGSWGSTLALAYAQSHPRRVSRLVLCGVTTTRRREIDWLFRGVGRFLPEQWQRFREAVPEAAGDEGVVAAYAARMEHPEAAVREAAADAWTRWEDAVIGHEVSGDPRAYTGRPQRDRLALVRICTRYFANAAWLQEGALLERAHQLRDIPGTLIHGRLDLSSPLETAWRLQRAWPRSQLHVVEDSGHTGSPSMNECLLAALDGPAAAPKPA